MKANKATPELVASVALDEYPPRFGMGARAYEAFIIETARIRGLDTTKPYKVKLNPKKRVQEFYQERKSRGLKQPYFI